MTPDMIAAMTTAAGETIMGAIVQCFVDLMFQGRLCSGDELYQAEIAFLTEQLEEHGAAVFRVPSYCQVESTDVDAAGTRWLTILLRTRGTWIRLFVEVRRPDVLVLYDRRRG